jgi:hypothetical protein
MTNIDIDPHAVATATDLRNYVTQHANLRVDSANGDPLYFHVLIIDARQVWGRVDLRVLPMAGSGTQWVGLSRISNLHHAERGEVDTDA